MTIRSRFDKGNIVLVFDTISKIERYLYIVEVEKWEIFNGFTYKVSDLYFAKQITEKYDDFDFVNQFEVKMIFGNSSDFESWKKESK